MKKTLVIASATLVCAALFAQRQPKASDVIKLSQSICDFGKTKQGVPVSCTFTLTNVSQVPVFIKSAVCQSKGCRAVGTKIPILPGKKGAVIVTYSAAIAGVFHARTVVKLKHVALPVDLMMTGVVTSAQH